MGPLTQGIAVKYNDFLDTGFKTVVLSYLNPKDKTTVERTLYLILLSRPFTENGHNDVIANPICERNVECLQKSKSEELARKGRVGFIEVQKTKECGEKLVLGLFEGQKNTMRVFSRAPNVVIECDNPYSSKDLGVPQTYEYWSAELCGSLINGYRMYVRSVEMRNAAAVIPGRQRANDLICGSARR